MKPRAPEPKGRVVLLLVIDDLPAHLIPKPKGRSLPRWRPILADVGRVALCVTASPFLLLGAILYAVAMALAILVGVLAALEHHARRPRA